ncbi:MAG: hypothetical protein ACRDPD_04880 [Streptosporangiaceae bacterium]
MAGQQAAPAPAAAVGDLYIAVRALPGTLPGGPGQGAPGTVPEKVRRAAGSIGAAWQCLGGSQPAGAAATPSCAGGVLREAVHRAVTAWSRPAATGQDRDEVIEGAMDAVHGLAAAAGYLAWGSSGLRAGRLRNAQGYLEVPASSCARPSPAHKPPAGNAAASLTRLDRAMFVTRAASAHPGFGRRCPDTPPGTRAAIMRGRQDRAGNGVLTRSANCWRTAHRCAHGRRTGPIHGNSRDTRR